MRHQHTAIVHDSERASDSQPSLSAASMSSTGILVSMVLLVTADGRPKHRACRRSYVYRHIRRDPSADMKRTHHNLPPEQSAFFGFLRGQAERLSVAMQTELKIVPSATRNRTGHWAVIMRDSHSGRS